MIINKTKIVFESTITLNEVEIRALCALVGYGTNPFLEAFYEKMGKHYLSPHEKGIHSLFKQINEQVMPELVVIENARKKVNTW